MAATSTEALSTQDSSHTNLSSSYQASSDGSGSQKETPISSETSGTQTDKEVKVASITASKSSASELHSSVKPTLKSEALKECSDQTLGEVKTI